MVIGHQLFQIAGAFTLQDSSGALVDGIVTISNTVATFTSTLALHDNEVYTARLSDALTDLTKGRGVAMK